MQAAAEALCEHGARLSLNLPTVGHRLALNPLAQWSACSHVVIS